MMLIQAGHRHTNTALTLLAVMLYFLPAGAQNEWRDSAYHTPHLLKNNSTAYLGRFYRSISIKSAEEPGNDASLHFSPNSSAFVGASGQYKKLFLLIEASVPGTHKVSPRQTDVRGYGLFLSHFTKNWGVTAFAAYNRGLLMRNGGRMMYNDRNDIRMTTAGVHLYYFFNGARFSYPAAAAALAQQKKSAGSFMLLITPAARLMRSQGSIIPEGMGQHHLKGYNAPLKSIDLMGVQVKGGYAYNFLLGKKGWYLSPMAWAGAGADYHTIAADNMRQKGINLTTGIRAKLVAGYNGIKWFGTLDMLTDITQAYLYKSRVTNAYREVSVNVGVRF